MGGSLRERRAEGRCELVRVDPANGAVGVFRDAQVMVAFSRPLDPATLSAQSVRVEDREGAVPARLALSPDRRLVVWRGQRLFRPGVAHLIHVTGLRDTAGGDVSAHLSCFVPCGLAAADLLLDER